MKHLASIQFADAIEGRLSEAARAHLDICPRCASRVESLRDAVREAQAAEDLPEPSPLFWEHFSANVRAAVA